MEQFTHQRADGRVPRSAGRHPVSNGERRDTGQLVRFGRAPFCRLGRLGDVRPGRDWPLGKRPEVLLSLIENLRRRDVPGHGQDRVVGRVVMLVETLDVLDGGRVKVFEVSVEIVRVGEPVEGLLGKIEPKEAPVRPIQNVDAHLLLNHLALVLQIGGREVQGFHPVGLEPQDRIERGGRRRLDILGKVVARVAVIESPAPFNDLIEGPFRRLGRTLEHHVLEQMRESGASLRLQAEADPVGDAQSKGGRRVFLGDYHHQPVVQFLHGRRNPPLLGERARAGDGQESKDKHAETQAIHWDSLSVGGGKRNSSNFTGALASQCIGSGSV